MKYYRCPRCSQITPRTDGDDSAFVCRNEECADPTPEEVKQERDGYERLRDAILAKRPEPLVFYVSFADRVKIGTSTNLKQRLRVLHHDVLLAVEPGSFDIETRRHQQFATARVPGQKEWFTRTPELLAHIDAVRAEHGAPEAFAR